MEYNITAQSFQSPKNDNTIYQEETFIPCNNPENLIKKDTAELILRVLYMCLFPVIEFFGVTTNVINCIVFVRHGLKDRINLCLFSLALTDTTFLLLIFAAKFFPFLGLFDKDLEEYWEKKYLGTVLGTMMGALALSNTITLIISIERCLCVMFPFAAKRILKTRYMAAIIMMITLYCVGAYSLLSAAYLTVSVTDPVTNMTRWDLQVSDFFLENETVLIILYNHVLSLTVPSVTLVTVIVTTCITVTRLKQTLAWRHQSSDSKGAAGDKRDAAVTKMLTVVCVIYVTTAIPSLTQSFARFVVRNYAPTGKYCNIFEVIQTMARVFEVTNSSVNFIVYFTMGSRFRDTVRQLFGTWREKRNLLHSPYQLIFGAVK